MSLNQNIPNGMSPIETPIPLNDDPNYPEQQQNVASFWDPKEYLEVLKHYTEDAGVPDKVKKSNWGIFCKALPQTFLNDADTAAVDLFGNILRIDSLMSEPAHKLTYEMVQQLDQIQLYFFLTAKRAIGTNEQKINERILQVTQIGQRINTNNERPLKQAGFFKRMAGAF